MQRAHILLACGAGETNTASANQVGLTEMTDGKRRKRYRELSVEGLHDVLRPRRPRIYKDDMVAVVINRALQAKFTGQHPVECPLSGRRHRHLQNHRSPLGADLLRAAPQAEASPLRGSLTATCATTLMFYMNTDATTSRIGVWPPGAGLHRQAPNHPMLLHYKCTVVSDGLEGLSAGESEREGVRRGCPESR